EHSTCTQLENVGQAEPTPRRLGGHRLRLLEDLGSHRLSTPSGRRSRTATKRAKTTSVFRVPSSTSAPTPSARPTMIPAAKAPRMLPSPPSTAETKLISISERPAFGVTGSRVDDTPPAKN